MSSQPRTRQELYEQIRASSKDEVILKEMVRLGFWDPTARRVEEPAGELQRLKKLRQELTELQRQEGRLHNVEQVRQQLYEERLAASRHKQQETKLRRERERVERARVWAEEKARDIHFLGEKVSGGLEARSSNADRLLGAGLPFLETPAQLAAAMNIAVSELRFLAYDRPVSRVSHYRHFTMPKKTGGVRHISAPMPRLKHAQHWVLDTILDRVPPHEAAHGFREGRSIVSNAAPHVGAEVLVNLDLKDFFPGVAWRRVRGLFRALGYSEAVATTLALLCTEPEVDEVELDGQRFFVASGERHLPQGAPTSPALSNLICRRLDRRLTAIARKLGFVYTRYADDLSFSLPRPIPGVPAASAPAASAPAASAPPAADSPGAVRKPAEPLPGVLLRRVRYAIASEGFTVHPDKTRVLRRSKQQEVTGLVVNDKLGVDRAELRRFRALLHQISLTGPAGKRWGEATGEAVLPVAVGYASFVAMVSPDRGIPLRQEALRLQARWGKGGAPDAPVVDAPVVDAPVIADAPVADAPVIADAPVVEAPPVPPPARKKWWKIF
jgi:hypothetical protein